MHAPPGIEPALLARLFARANAERWQISRERFATALASSLAHARAGGGGADAETYLSSLHLDDFAIAIACADGHEGAWEHFVAEHRAAMERAARAMDPAGGTDLADALYGDLFGLQTKAGERQSLFRYFHGRSRLGTWLRAVLSQRHIDRVRATRRHDPIPEEDSGATMPPPLTAKAASSGTDAERRRFVALMRDALMSAIAALEPKDRLRLAAYYAEDMKLAAIGRMVGEHEATVSRHLTRTRVEIRAHAEKRLRERGLDDAGIRECFTAVAEDAGGLDLSELLGESPGRKKGAAGRSKM